MFKGDDRETFYSLSLLKDIVSQGTKPIVFWIGAGASSWCKYPRWPELADNVHAEFRKYEHTYNQSYAKALIESEDYPKFFSYCSSISKSRYFSLLTKFLSSRNITAVYNRFISVLSDIESCSIVTTNVDQCLEKHLNGFELIERSDIDRSQDLLQSGQSFILKLHGSISSVETMIFTEDDYISLTSNVKYIELLKLLLSSSTVVFIGYGVSDDYAINLLKANADLKDLFGDGPHFLVTSSLDHELPDSVHKISYIPEPHADHRSSIQVAEVIRSVKNETISLLPAEASDPRPAQPIQSAYFISDLFPPGKWQSSNTAIATGEDGREIEISVGTGFVDEELPYKVSTAFHDLSVGLICFERIYFPLSSLSKVHDLLGSNRFWSLVDSEAIRFVHCENEPSIIYPKKQSVANGDIGMIALAGGLSLGPISVGEVIRKHLKPAPGNEATANAQLDRLEKSISIIETDKSTSVSTLTRGTLLHPDIRNLLGFSDALPPTSIPRWIIFPVLRLANIILNGIICETLRIPALKLHYGGNTVAGIAFAAVHVDSWADEFASYVTTGSFLKDIGAAINNDPSLLDTIMKFRETQAADNLRKEIMEGLETNKGGEVATAIDAGMHKAVPIRVIEGAHEELSRLMLAGPGVKSIPAVWTNSAYDDKAIALWRRRASSSLTEYCQSNRIGPYDLCPCGSGEKLKFCCEQAVRR